MALKGELGPLVLPIMDIMNTSFSEGRPLSWKEAHIVPLPKQRPIQDVNKHLPLHFPYAYPVQDCQGLLLLYESNRYKRDNN